MPLRNLTPLTFRPKGLSDTQDGTNAFAGAMVSLQNLVPAPGTRNMWIPRAASDQITDFPGFSSPGAISGFKIIGTRVYGMVASSRFPGHDEPFCFDVEAGLFVAVSGVTATNVPTTPLTTGDWTPPTIEAVTNSRIIVTHPGFSGGAAPYFGWFDVSNYLSTSLKGNTFNGSYTIQSVNDGGTSAPIIDGVQVGMSVSGSGIPAGTVVTAVANGTFDLQTTGNTDGTSLINAVGSTVGAQIGMGVSGPTIAAGSTILAITPTSITLNQPTLGPGTAIAIVISGGGTITLSQAATASANSVPLTISGGTFSAPQWGAGNTNTNPLASVPKCVFGFNGRAYYGMQNYAVFSDILNPTQITNASQALQLGDSTPVTAMAGMPFSNTVTGGVVADLIVFKGVAAMFQISGDAALGTLTLNAISGAVGTLAPLTITSTPMGLAWVAPDGLRVLNFSGIVGEPMGTYGSGVSVPFVNAQTPSRMAADYNQNTLRITVQDDDLAQEYCFNVDQQIWHGPHTFPVTIIAAYTSSTRVGFIIASANAPGTLWFHTLVPKATSSYVENGTQLSWTYETSLLPDNERMSINLMVETELSMILGPTQYITVTPMSESGAALDTLTMNGPQSANNPIWGAVTWGNFNWGGITSFFKQFRLPWHLPLVFKQLFLKVEGLSADGFAISNLYLGYQPRRYMLEDIPAIVGYTGLETTIRFAALQATTYTSLMAGIVEQQPPS